MMKKLKFYSPKIIEKITTVTFLYIFWINMFIVADTICVDSLNSIKSSIDEYHIKFASYTKPVIIVIFMLLISWLADSHYGKYSVLRLCFVLSMVLPAVIMVTWILPSGMFFLLSNVAEAFSFSFIGVAYAFGVDQIRSKETIRPFTFIFIEMELFLKLFMQSEATFPKLFFALVITILISLSFILSENYMKMIKVDSRCVEKTLRCLWIAIAKRIKLKAPDGQNWIERTEPECDDLTILRTRVTLYILPLIFLFSFLWSLNVGIHFKILTQQAISLPYTLDLIGLEFIVHISVFICVLLFEFAVPYIRFRRIEPPIITAGLIIFACGLIVAFFVQRSVEETKLLLPGKTAQLTFYNMLKEKIIVTSEINKLNMNPYKKLVLLNLITQDGRLDRNFTIQKKNHSSVLNAEDGKSFSVVISDDGFRQMPYPDPIAMSYEKMTRSARVFFVFGTNVTGNFIFKSETEVIYLFRVKHSPSLIYANVQDGEYKISMQLKRSRVVRLERDYPMLYKFAYSVVIYDKNVTKGKVYPVFCPYPVSLWLLIPQLMLLIFGMSVCLVSWFSFLFYYSFPSLRSVTITIYFILIFIWDTFFSSSDIFDPKFILLYVLIHSCCTLLFLYSYVIK